MKRTALALVLLFSLSVVALAQAIVVTSPKGGESWALSSAKTVTWTAKGFPANTKARLVLLRDGTKVGDLAVNVPIEQGSWPWAKAGDYVGGTAAAGDGYAVRVRDMNNLYAGAKSPGTFSLSSLNIVSPSALVRNAGIIGIAGGIPVSSPPTGAAMEPGTEFFILWDKAGIQAYPQVALDVFTPDRKTKVGPIGTAAGSLRDNTGKYEAVIFNARYEWGKDYVIRVATPDEKHVGWSGVFHVTPLQAVEETMTFTGAHTVAYLKTDKSIFAGCLDTHGHGANMPPVGYWAAGWENLHDDPFGPCWFYIGHVYRTIVDPSGIYQGSKVTKAVLHFTVNQGTKQALHVLRRDAPGDDIGVASTLIATIGTWDFGQSIDVDVTSVVQAWCTGQAPNRGFIIRGGNENFDHDNVKARCLITAPELIITRINYK